MIQAKLSQTMTNPDRAEVGLQLTSVAENPKKNGHFPRWFREHSLASRIFLAALTATPYSVFAADAIYRSVNPPIVYASGVATGKLIGIERLAECKWDIHMEATGFRPGLTIGVITFNDHNEYNCPGGDKNEDVGAARIDAWQFVGVADSNGHIFFDIIQNQYGSFRYTVYSSTITAADHDSFSINASYSKDQIPINTPSAPTPPPTFTDAQKKLSEQAGYLPTRTPTPAPAPTNPPRPEVRPTQVVSSSQNSAPGIPGWLWGLAASPVAGLAVYWGYKRGKGKNLPPPPTPGTGGGIAGATGGIPNPNTGPNVGPNAAGSNPNFGPSVQKEPDWIIGEQEFIKKWQVAKTKLLPIRPGEDAGMPEYVLDRFKAGMNVIHGQISDNTTTFPEPMRTRVRAGIEYLIPEIWSNDIAFERFFISKFMIDFLTPEERAKIIFIPESIRNLTSFTDKQKQMITIIHRRLASSLHPDPDFAKNGADPNLTNKLDTLTKTFNSDWDDFIKKSV